MVLTSDEIADVSAKVRSALPGLCGELRSDAELRRWAEGWDGNLDEILPRIRTAHSMRRALSLDSVPLLPFATEPAESVRQLNEFCSRAHAPGALQLFPSGFAGFDKMGNVVVIDSMGRIQPKDLLSTAKCSDVIAIRMIESEFYRRLANAQSERLGRLCGIVLIFDFVELSWANFDVQLFTIYVDIVHIMQQLFPELCHKIYFVRAPSIVEIGFSMVKPVLSKRTRDKVHVLGKEWKESLLGEIAADQLPVEWGGTAVGEGGRPYGLVRVGGKVADPALLYRPRDNPREPANSGLPLQSLSVGRGAVHVETRRLHSAAHLAWFFRITGGDLYFWVDAEVEGEEGTRLLQPRFRLNTDNAPEWGSVDAAPGTYRLHFDNSHSYFKAKTLQYYVAVEEA